MIQPLIPQRLPCYDFTPIINHTLGACLPATNLNYLSLLLPKQIGKVSSWVSPTTSGIINSHGVTGGVYKAREHIHRGMLIRDY